jgi:hypothetical protein
VKLLTDFVSEVTGFVKQFGQHATLSADTTHTPLPELPSVRTMYQQSLNFFFCRIRIVFSKLRAYFLDLKKWS